MSEDKQPISVHCVMMSTLDGKIGSGIAGVDIVDDYLDVYRTIDDSVAGPYEKKNIAWMCGRETSKLYFADSNSSPLPNGTSIIDDSDFFANPNAGRFFVTIDTKGVLRWKSNSVEFFSEHGPLHLIIIVTRSTPKNYLAYLKSKNISYIMSENDEVQFGTILTKLNFNFDISTLLLEGGGKINGSFMTQGLVDEIHLLLLPMVLNRTNAPSLFDSQNIQGELKHFALVESSTKPRGSVLLHYRKK